MKIYLDDERATPEGWVRCYWAEEVIFFLKNCAVDEVSLDHDLGDDNRGTGLCSIKGLKAEQAHNFVGQPINI